MHRIDIDSEKEFDIESFLKNIKEESFVWEYVPEYDEENTSDERVWRIYRQGKSTTPFVLVHFIDAGQYSLFMESLASYQDYRYFADFSMLIAQDLGVDLEKEGINLEILRSEDWAEDSIAEEVAYLKAVLSAGYKYMFSFGDEEDLYVDTETLSKFCVSVNSSTPRIYGYIQYALKHNMLGSCINESDDYPDIEVQVPEHKSVGKVKSWQPDGSETWESYCQDDVRMLIETGKRYKEGSINVEGVVLNDLGTLYQEGIGVGRNYSSAVYWYEAAISAGDRFYAPGNLGDIWRKGGYGLVRNLEKAMQAYLKGEDPYAHYRVGQAYEEGWSGRVDSLMAFKWYAKAANEGHHLALKRLMPRTKIVS